MSEQLVITMAAATIGFISAVFFCIGTVFNTADKILLQSTPFWDFSEPMASSLAAQRSQYVVGSLLLLAAFCLQIAAALASSTNPAILPLLLRTWISIVVAVFIPTSLFAGSVSFLIYKSTMAKVNHREKERREKEEYKL